MKEISITAENIGENCPDVEEIYLEQPGGGAFLSQLLGWYREHRRVLPWREDPTPYHVWLSEIMLQQTRVEAVREYYRRFLLKLPDIASLAAAEEDVYLKLWEGLGYYSRVRNLHKGAVTVMEEYGGLMPETADELKKIPGIGPYTAAAVASIAFGEPVPAVDGNLLRVFARLTCYGESIKDEKAKKAAFAFYDRILKEGMNACEFLTSDPAHGNIPGDFNQALMDLGAMVCLPNAAPCCGQCPLAEFCAAHGEGKETEYPIKDEKKARKTEELTVFLIHNAERIALHKRPAKGLLAGLYEYPNVPGHLSDEEALQAVRKMGISPLRIRRLPDASHIFTHKEWHMRGYEILADELAGETVEKAGAGSDPDHMDSGGKSQTDSTDMFLAEIRQIRDVYSVPSAFAAFTGIVLNADGG